MTTTRFFAALMAATAIIPPAMASDTQAAAFVVDGEYKADWALEAVKVSAANAAGWTGKGVVVAVFDSGIRYQHSEFTGALVEGYDAYLKRADAARPVDDFGHGTMVASVIGARDDGKGVQGVAPDVKLMSVDVITASGAMTLTDANLANAINWTNARMTSLNQGGGIMNNSWNSSFTLSQMGASILKILTSRSAAAWQKAVDAGGIVVFAAGNTGAKDPGYWAALPQVYNGLQKGWLVAVAADQTGSIASYSSRCGVTAAYCMAAPGSSLLMASNSILNGYSVASGTSFAAPVLSGAAADLKQMWPQLKGDQILAIMFKTANKSGVYANRAVYGQGMLDMQKAVQPVGTVAIATGATTSATKIAAASSVAVTSSAFGGAMSVGGIQMVVLDDFGRDYKLDSTAFIAATAQPYDLEKGLAALGSGLQTIHDHGGLSFALVGGYENTAYDDKGALPKFVMALSGEGQKTTIAHGVGNSHLFGGGAALVDGSGSLAKADAIGSAYLGLSGKDAWGSSWSTKLDGDARLTVAGVYGNVADKPADWSLEASDPTRKGSEAMVGGFAARFSKSVGDTSLSLEGGMVHETNSVLGSVSQGALSLGNGATTQYVGVHVDMPLSESWAAFGGYEAGRTTVRSSDDSLIASLSGVTTNAWSLGVTGRDFAQDGDRFNMAVSQPLRVNGGSASINAATGVNEDGTLVYSSTSQSLVARGRETDFQVGYQFGLSEGERITAAALLRVQPDNIRDAKNEGVAMARYQFKF